MSNWHGCEVKMRFTGITGERHPKHDELIDTVRGLFNICELEDVSERSREGEVVYTFGTAVKTPLEASDFGPEFAHRFGPCKVSATVFVTTHFELDGE